MDGLVFDMSSQSEGTPEVFTKKDWISILDNQNQSYQGNQVVLDSSQIANSNKYINYREAYLAIPLLLTLTSSYTPTQVALITNSGAGGADAAFNSTIFQPATILSDWVIGLKNWYGSIIHSFTCDYAGTTIIQQTPYLGMWNTFRLMTTLSMNDVLTQGSSIGFYPDTAQACGVTVADANGLAYANPAPTSGVATGATFNNRNCPALFNVENGGISQARASGLPFNKGMFMRQACWNFDLSAETGGGGLLSNTVGVYADLTSVNSLNLLYKSYIFNKQNPTITPAFTLNTEPAHTTALSGNGVWQACIMAQVYLKHIHPFFESIPLLKGVFMKLTANLNQSSVNFTTLSAYDTGAVLGNDITSTVVQSPLGGVSPIMISQLGGAYTDLNGNSTFAGKQMTTGDYIVSLAVGRRCLNTTQTNIGVKVADSPLIGSITLNCPAYSFNPVFESSYLSSPVKKIVYTDVYQYQVNNVATNSLFNNLVSNGIANIKSVLVLPYFTAASNGGLIPWQSPYDPAGAGPTSPLCLLTQFNIQISGQNMIYNTQRYSYEQYMNQLKGHNSVNGGQTDGLVSGLIGFAEFEAEYNYYFVDCSRMLPVEQAVPKSINILGTNTSQKDVSLYVFVTYGCEVSVDILTGARV